MLHQGAQAGLGDGEPLENWVMPVLAPESTARRSRWRGQAGKCVCAGAPPVVPAPDRARHRRGRSRRNTTGSRSYSGKAIRPGPYALSERRELLQIVCQRKDEHPFPVTLHEGLPLMQLSLHPGCTVCEACFRVCPTAALQIDENPDAWALTFRQDRCVACMACLEVCQPRVLDAEASFDARPEQANRVLLSLNKQRCQRCDRHFVSPSPEQTCPICRDDEDAFAAIFG